MELLEKHLKKDLMNLKLLDFGDYIDRLVGKLSGGQRRRFLAVTGKMLGGGQ